MVATMKSDSQLAVELAEELDGLLDKLEVAKGDQEKSSLAVKDLQSEQDALKEQLEEQKKIRHLQRGLEGLELKLQAKNQEKSSASAELASAKELLSELQKTAGINASEDQATDADDANTEVSKKGRQARPSARRLKPTRSRSTSRRRRRSSTQEELPTVVSEDDEGIPKSSTHGDSKSSRGARGARTSLRRHRSSELKDLTASLDGGDDEKLPEASTLSKTQSGDRAEGRSRQSKTTSPKKGRSSSKTRSSLRKEKSESSEPARRVQRTRSSSLDKSVLDDDITDTDNERGSSSDKLGVGGSHPRERTSGEKVYSERSHHERTSGEKVDGEGSRHERTPGRSSRSSRSSRIKRRGSIDKQRSHSKSRRSSRRSSTSTDTPKALTLDPAALYTKSSGDDESLEVEVATKNAKSARDTPEPAQDAPSDKSERKGRTRTARASSRAAPSSGRSHSLSRSKARGPKRQLVRTRSSNGDDFDKEANGLDLLQDSAVESLGGAGETKTETVPSNPKSPKGKLRVAVEDNVASDSVPSTPSSPRGKLRIPVTSIEHDGNQGSVPSTPVSPSKGKIRLAVEDKDPSEPSTPSSPRGKLRVTLPSIAHDGNPGSVPSTPKSPRGKLGSQRKDRTCRSPTKPPSSPKKSQSLSVTKTTLKRSQTDPGSTLDAGLQRLKGADSSDTFPQTPMSTKGDTDSVFTSEYVSPRRGREQTPRSPKKESPKKSLSSTLSPRSPTKAPPMKSLSSPVSRTSLTRAQTEPVPRSHSSASKSTPHGPKASLLDEDSSVSHDDDFIHLVDLQRLDEAARKLGTHGDDQPGSCLPATNAAKTSDHSTEQSESVPSTPANELDEKRKSPSRPQSSRVPLSPQKARSASLTRKRLRKGAAEIVLPPSDLVDEKDMHQSQVDSAAVASATEDIDHQDLQLQRPAEVQSDACPPTPTSVHDSEASEKGTGRVSRTSSRVLSSPKKTRSSPITRASLRNTKAEASNVNSTNDIEASSDPKPIAPHTDDLPKDDDYPSESARELAGKADTVGADGRRTSRAPVRALPAANRSRSRSRKRPSRRDAPDADPKSSTGDDRQHGKTTEEPGALPSISGGSEDGKEQVEREEKALNDEVKEAESSATPIGAVDDPIPNQRTSRGPTRNAASSKKTRSRSRKRSSRQEKPSSESKISKDPGVMDDKLEKVAQQLGETDPSEAVPETNEYNAATTSRPEGNHVASGDGAAIEERLRKVARQLSADDLVGYVSDSASEQRADEKSDKKASTDSEVSNNRPGSPRRSSSHLASLMAAQTAALLGNDGDSSDDDSIAAVSQDISKVALNLGMDDDNSSSSGAESMAAESEHSSTKVDQSPATGEDPSSSEEGEEEEDFFDVAEPIRATHELDILWSSIYDPASEPQQANDDSPKAREKARLTAQRANRTSAFYEDIVLPALFETELEKPLPSTHGELDPDADPDGTVAQDSSDGSALTKHIVEPSGSHLAHLKTSLTSKEKFRSPMAGPLGLDPVKKGGLNDLKNADPLMKDVLQATSMHGQRSRPGMPLWKRNDDHSTSSSSAVADDESSDYDSSDSEWMREPKTYVHQITVEGIISRQKLKAAAEGELAHIKAPHRLGVQDMMSPEMDPADSDMDRSTRTLQRQESGDKKLPPRTEHRSKGDKDPLSKSLHSAMKWGRRSTKIKEDLQMNDEDESPPVQDLDAVANSMTAAMTDFDAVTKTMAAAMKWPRRARATKPITTEPKEVPSLAVEKEITAPLEGKKEFDTIAKSIHVAMKWRRKAGRGQTEAAGMQMLDDDESVMSMD